MLRCNRALSSTTSLNIKFGKHINCICILTWMRVIWLLLLLLRLVLLLLLMPVFAFLFLFFNPAIMFVYFGWIRRNHTWLIRQPHRFCSYRERELFVHLSHFASFVSFIIIIFTKQCCMRTLTECCTHVS